MYEVNEYLVGDARETLATLDHGIADLIIADPPYWRVVTEYWDRKHRTLQDYTTWVAAWLEEVTKVARPAATLVLFGYTRNLLALYDSFQSRGWMFKQEIVIDKGKQAMAGRNTQPYTMFPTTTEVAWVFTRDTSRRVVDLLRTRQKELGLTAKQINEAMGAKATGGGMWSILTGDNVGRKLPTAEQWERLQEVLEFSVPYYDIRPIFHLPEGLTNVWTDIQFYNRREERIHPTQKPVELISRFVQAMSDQGSVVLDPFGGSGTTAISCIDLNRRYILIDSDEAMVEKARKRIASHLLQGVS